ncbi:MAG: L,D-transpeptidase family protein [Symbiobacteriia bacterium]
MRVQRQVIRLLGLLLSVVILAAAARPVGAAGSSVAKRLEEQFGTGCLSGEEQRDLFWTKPALRGSDVRELQELLRASGFDVGPADGVFGERTHQAVLAFQRQQRQRTDGVVTEVTWQLLAGAFPADTGAPDLPRPQGEIVLIVNVPTRTLTVLADGKPYASFVVAVGKDETPTPVGEWRVAEKSSGWGGGFGERWLGLDVPWGIYGIHGTNKPWSVGRSLSGGCMRMHNEDVIQLWDWVPLGTRVIILGLAVRLPEWSKEPQQRGAGGWVVLEVQRRMREQGYETGSLDGRFGGQTEQAVRLLQRNNGLKETGRIDAAVYRILGL